MVILSSKKDGQILPRLSHFEWLRFWIAGQGEEDRRELAQKSFTSTSVWLRMAILLEDNRHMDFDAGSSMRVSRRCAN